MSYASDKLYNGYLRRRMPAIVTKVKVREIIVHLPCLTAHDRENIEAKRENYGNFDSMVLLLDCLKRRDNWPDEFIQALEECEHSSIAAEIRAEYDSLRGVDNSSSSPSTTVTRAHIHPAPTASPVQESVTGSGDVATVAVVVQPAESAEAPPDSDPQGSPPLKAQPQDPNSTVQQLNNTDTISPPDVVSAPEVVSPTEAVSIPDVASPSEAVPEPTESTQIKVAAPPITPPPSPEIPHTDREITAHQEPEENSESDIQAITGVTVLPNKINTATEMEVLTDSISNSAQSHPGGQNETNTTSDPDLPKTTSIANIQPPQIQANIDVTDGSSFLTLTPEKPPVQDTAPPVVVPVIVEPEESTELFTYGQETESSRQLEAASNSLPENCVIEDNDSFLSKPEVLISLQSQNHDGSGISAQTSSEEPYSGDSRRLELSTSILGSHNESPTHVPVCTTASFAPVNTASELTCQENSIEHGHEEPEENHYESPPDSLESEELLVNVVHVSEEPSILNLDFQTPAPPTQIINGKAAEVMAPSSPSSIATSSTCSTADGAFGSTVCGDISPPLKSNVVNNKPELLTVTHSKEDKRIQKFSTNAKYIVTAAGVGAIALLMAWKFRN